MKYMQGKNHEATALMATRILALCVVSLLFFPGCAAESNSGLKQDAGATEERDSATNRFEDSSPTVSRVFGRVVELLSPEGIEGVEVCVHESEEIGCRTTDAEGFYEFAEINEGTQLLLTTTLKGHVGGAAPITVSGPEYEVAPLGMASTTILGLQQSALGVDEVENTGQIAFGASNGISGDKLNIEGFKVTLNPDTGDGPYYLSSLGLPDTALTQSSSNGGGLWVNLPAGDYELSYEDIEQDCKTLLGWDGPQTLKLTILADKVTYARIECTE